MKRKIPRYKKHGNLIELPFLRAVPLDPEVSPAISLSYIEHKLMSDPHFQVHSQIGIRALALHFADQARAMKGDNPGKTLDDLLDDLIAMDKRGEDALLARKDPSQGPLSLNEIMAAIGRDIIEKYDIRKTWTILADDRTKDEVMEALSNGKFKIQETRSLVVIFPEFD